MVGFTIGHPNREGLGRSILTGIQGLYDAGFQDHDFLTQLPGNNQRTSESIAELATNNTSNHLIIGWKVNTDSRPYPKRFFSRVLQLVINMYFPMTLAGHGKLCIYNEAGERLASIIGDGIVTLINGVSVPVRSSADAASALKHLTAGDVVEVEPVDLGLYDELAAVAASTRVAA